MKDTKEFFIEKKENLKAKKKLKSRKIMERGITLIALVVTIIILLILSGVTLNIALSDNGLFKKAKEAVDKYEKTSEDEQRQLAMTEAMLNYKNKEYEDKNGEKVTIPAGFAVSSVEGENTVNEGLVIIDSEGNEFVWIPVKDGNIENGEAEKLNDEVAWEKQEYDEMKKSVQTYKGFYIGRYEAGSTTERKGYQDTGNNTTKMIVKRDQYPYVYVGWGKYNKEDEDYSGDICGTGDYSFENNGRGAVYLSRHMYDGKNVGIISTLCYGVQWDAMLDFLKKDDRDVSSDSSDWGNYYGSQFKISRQSVKKQLAVRDSGGIGSYQPFEDAFGSFGGANLGYILTTGATERNKSKNVYDVAGNCDEWLMSMVNENVRELAGGSIVAYGEYKRANFKNNRASESWTGSTSFRTALYINPTR